MLKTNVTDKRPRREKFKVQIKLPSGGFANRTAFPDGMITVYPWDSLIDAWLTEATQKAEASDRPLILYRLMEKVCNLNGCKLEDFVLGDVNAVLLTARSIQNSNTVEYVAVCNNCGAEETERVKVPDELALIGGKDQSYTGSDSFTLPECKDVVEVRPLCIRDEIAITTRTPENKKLVSDFIAHTIASVVSVNSTQPDRIEELVEWFMSLSPADAAFLEEQQDKLSPHLSQELPQKCEQCGNVFPFRLVLNEEFFRSGRIGATRRALAANL
jgi:predicted Zn-ribbon and HTH transcriptional regulator